MTLCPVILAGGGGTRLWPLSREFYPKQFINLFNEYSMLQNTLLRLQGIEKDIEVSAPLIICNDEHRFLVSEQMNNINVELQQIVLEPEGRNTAPALTIAALIQLHCSNDPVLLMVPADHVIMDVASFQSAIKDAYKLAMEGYVVTFGITPDLPETGYGYIKYKDPVNLDESIAAYSIDEFTEKPDQATAECYIEEGKYLWNSGIFMMKASVWSNDIKKYNNKIYQSCEAVCNQLIEDGNFVRLNTDLFSACPADSIDYAVMEPLSRQDNNKLVVIPINVGWSDIGAWSSVWKLSDKDRNNNHIKGDVITVDVHDCEIRSEYRLVSLLGCKDLVVVETADTVMVADKNKSQDVKLLVEQLKNNNREERQYHRRVYRPWGSYETVDSGECFQVKRIIVKPGRKLSLQYHHKRAEHWVVVKGTATVTRDDEVFELSENQSTYIPTGMKHRLENNQKDDLEIIEVQSGDYLGEDDIVRIKDDFGRN